MRLIMRIVFIGCRDIRLLGGIESYTLNLSRELVKLGHECVIWCESDHRSTEIIEGVEIKYHSGPKSVFLCKPWCGLKATIRTILSKEKVSIIHYNAWGPSLFGCIVARLYGVPSLMEGHGLEWQRTKYSPMKKKIMRYMEGVTAKINQHLVMCSQGQVDYFLKEYGKDSVCIPGAVNMPDLEKTNNSDILERFNLETKRFFLYLGRLVQDKNPDYLIEAYKKVLPSGFKLVIAGDNASDSEYVNHLHNISTGIDDIVFTGAVYSEDKESLLKNAYCFCLPSTIEGLSIVMMEAASYKLPVIASDIDANKEFLKQDAIYVRPENTEDLITAINQSIAKSDFLLKIIDNNYQKLLDYYTWDKVAYKYVKYLNSIGVE